MFTPMNKRTKIFFIVLPIFLFGQSNAQTASLSLDSVYILAKQNYPLIKQHELIIKSKEYTLENISKGSLPQIRISGQASYQSDVTQFPKAIPGVPNLSKDQYKIVADVNQILYDGGSLQAQKKLAEANSLAESQKLEVELYKIKDRVNLLFFGILLLNQQLLQNELFKNDIRLALDKTVAAINNGTALKSSADVLKANLLEAEQKAIELKSNRTALMDLLALFIDRPVNEKTVFIKPEPISVAAEIKRPELLFFDYQNKIIDAKNKLLLLAKRPKISLFTQAGFGRPALNILSNSFDPFYIAGLRLSFPLSDFYTIKNEQALNRIKLQNISVEKETFLFNTHFQLTQQTSEITRLQQLLQIDEEIIPLRENIKKTSFAQLNFGVITNSDYLREVNAENKVRLDKILHETQLLMAEYSKQITTGE
jgi:outer membrane protein TolC